MPKFRRIPVMIEAVRIRREMSIQTLEGIKQGLPGDWLITGPDGEQYPCKNSLFKKLYEPVDKEAEKLILEIKDESLELDKG